MPDQDEGQSSSDEGDGTEGSSVGNGGSVLEEPSAEFEYTENAEDGAEENTMNEPDESE